MNLHPELFIDTMDDCVIFRDPILITVCPTPEWDAKAVSGSVHRLTCSLKNFND